MTCGECCKCCKSWDDWCLFLSCNCASSPPLLIHERKCLRAAWRLLWNFLIPLAVGSVPLQLVWALAQFLVACTLFLAMMTYGPTPKALSMYPYSKGKVAGFASTSLWFLLCLINVIVSLIVSGFFRNVFTSTFSVYIYHSIEGISHSSMFKVVPESKNGKEDFGCIIVNIMYILHSQTWICGRSILCEHVAGKLDNPLICKFYNNGIGLFFFYFRQEPNIGTGPVPAHSTCCLLTFYQSPPATIAYCSIRTFYCEIIF